MTYFGFLALFLFIPIMILGALSLKDQRMGRTLPPYFSNWPAWSVLLIHALIALVYTTPWDNYLVATRVWWYDPELVTGLVIGWVPIEEYTFFMVQPIFTGLWLLFLARRLPLGKQTLNPNSQRLRWSSVIITAVLWLGAVTVIAVGWQPGTYLALELGWALPPIMVQLAFGADILWRYRQLVLWSVIPTTVYLSLADTLALRFGTWTIDPAQSLGIMLGGQLPLEEFVFFFLTNVLLVFGITLALAYESKSKFLRSVRGRVIIGDTSPAP